ncbi:ribonuclease H-like domain-containing protein [Tanacetum coccineum]
MLQQRSAILLKLKDNLLRAQNRMRNQAILKRIDVSFVVGNWVFLKLQPYRQSSLAHRQSHKLAKRFYGPFPIKEREFVDDHQILLPFDILKYREVWQQGKLVPQVLVQWENQPTTNATWEPLKEFCHDFPDFDLEGKPIGEATKASNLQRILPEVQGRSHFTYILFSDMEDDVDISALTMEQYIALIPDDIKPGIVNPMIGDEVEFKINANFMRELRCKLFAGTDDEDAYEHVHTVLEIVDLFHFLGVTHDAIMLRVFPFTLKGRALRWKNSLPAGTITTWDLLKKEFILKILSPFNNCQEIRRNPQFQAREGRDIISGLGKIQ